MRYRQSGSRLLSVSRMSPPGLPLGYSLWPFAGVLNLALLLLLVRPTLAEEPAKVDLLIFAPHPDDEVLGCAGLMSRALRDGKRVGVVILTNGGGFPRAASVVVGKAQDELVAADFLELAAERQRQSVRGLRHIGIPLENLLFLGYPDSGLADIFRSREGAVYRQEFTNREATYGPVVADYRSSKHGRAAPYTRSAIIADIAELLLSRQPREIYVTHDVDTHGDHQAAFWFVREAAMAAGFAGEFYTYVNHGEVEPELPVRRVALTPAELAKKRLAIREHQIPIVHDHLQSYAKAEEVFWKVSLAQAAAEVRD